MDNVAKHVEEVAKFVLDIARIQLLLVEEETALGREQIQLLVMSVCVLVSFSFLWYTSKVNDIYFKYNKNPYVGT